MGVLSRVAQQEVFQILFLEQFVEDRTLLAKLLQIERQILQKPFLS
jgi:hypothetical protein